MSRVEIQALKNKYANTWPYIGDTSVYTCVCNVKCYSIRLILYMYLYVLVVIV